MEKTIFEQMGGTYTLQVDYYLPNFSLPAEGNKTIGIWGQRHLWYLKKYRGVTYYSLLTSGKLNSYLYELDKSCNNAHNRMIKDYVEKDGVTEKFKAENTLEWVRRMNNIRSRVEEIVFRDFIYV